MINVTVSDIVEAVGGRLLCGSADLEIRNIAIDSRTMKGDDIFVPIIGAKVDAHRFIEGAFAAGAVATFTSEHDQMEDNRPWIRVEDTVKALQDLGQWYRGRLKMPVIGITGSVGKTTTREMVITALSAGKKVYSTTGNSNGQLGVPLTISEADLSAEIAVLEMGMSEPGEMAKIAEIARVNVGIVTNIGVSHIENLGSQDNICREKMHMADGFTSENLMILNGDDPLLAAYRGNTQFATVFYGTGEECDYRASDIQVHDGRTWFMVHVGEESFPMSLAVPGIHNVKNALAALAAAGACGVDLKCAAEKLGEYQGFARRLQRLEKNGLHIIDDSYNASPDSMRAALQVLGTTEAEGRRIAVLADMLELGPDAPRFHYETGVYGAEFPIDQVFTVGTLIRNLAQAMEEAGVPVQSFDTNAEAAEVIKAYVQAGDTILLKGSNGMKLGEILQAL